MPTRLEIAERKRRNKMAHAVASQEMTAVYKGHALAKYMPELADAIHNDNVDIGVLRRRRGSLTDEQCIARVTDLLSYGVGERKACRVVGVVWREWNDWKRANLHNLKQQEALAKFIRINAMHDEIMEIVDDPDLRRADTKTVKKWVKDATTGKDKEIEVKEVVLTPREKLAIAEARISTRKWSLDAHSSRTRLPGGARSPATWRKETASASSSGRPNAARSTASHVFHGPASPSAAPSRLGSRSTRSIVQRVAIGGLQHVLVERRPIRCEM
jgi:hypothetical protein